MSITVVTGPPCSGKTTHITTHARRGDIIIDLDRIALALTADDTDHHTYGPHIRHVARQARTAAIHAAVTASQTTGARVWIIDTWPDVRRWEALGATVTTLDPGYDVCAARASRRTARLGAATSSPSGTPRLRRRLTPPPRPHF